MLVIGLAGILVQTTLFMIQGPAVASSPTPQKMRALVAPKADDPRGQADAQQWHLFGRYEGATDQGVNANISSARETELELALLGIFYQAQNKAQRWVIIAQPDEPNILYGPGDTLPGGAILEAIHPDHAMLRHEGVSERLSLANLEAMGGIEDVAGQHDDSGPGDEKLQTQRARILKELNLKPVNEHAAEGYRVLETPPDEKNPYGLQKGDIILSANGYPLGAKAEDILAKQVAESLGRAQVLVVRGGTRVEIDIQR
ncbi:MAG: type II secretion system protein N [Alcanivorax sp.]